MNKKLVVKNTLMLYIRMLIMMCIQLYTVPVIMHNLGVSDYGLYNVVGGITTLLAFIQGALASGSQRYLAFSLGQNDETMLKRTFISTRTIYMSIGMIMFLLLEVFGVWFLNSEMKIPDGRIVAANWVFQFSVFSFILNFFTLPYHAVIIAHEKLDVYALITIAESLLKLAAVISLQFVMTDKLITYAGLYFCVTLIIIAAYIIYCTVKYQECRTFALKWNHELGQSMVKYSIWNSIGAISGVLKLQGTNILLNLFYGTIVNAAHALGQQMSSVVSLFVNNIYTASRPQITKAFAANDEEGMWSLVFQSAKLGQFLMTLLIVPLIVEVEDIFTLWLGEYPAYAVNIVRLLLLAMMVETFSNQIIAVFQAKNIMRDMQIVSGGIQLLNIPTSYLCLKYFNLSPMIPYCVALGISCVYVVSILYMASRKIGLNIGSYIRKVVIRGTLVFALLLFCVQICTMSVQERLPRICLCCIAVAIYSPILIWFVGLCSNERKKAVSLIKKKYEK